MPLKDPSDFRIIGTPAKRLDVAGKVNGTAVFGIDVKVPGMKIATVAASPGLRRHAPRLRRSGRAEGRGRAPRRRPRQRGGRDRRSLLGRQAGPRGAAVQCDDGPNASLGDGRLVAALAKASEQKGAIAQSVGDVAAAFETAAAKVEAVYEMPLLAHATMEPMNCTVHVRGDGCDVWVGSQVVSRAQATAAEVTGLPLDKVMVHNQFLGGGFGRRLEVDYVTQAVRIAKQVDGPGQGRLEPRGGHPARHVPAVLLRPDHRRPRRAGQAGELRATASSARRSSPAGCRRLFKNDLDVDAVDGAVDLPYDFPTSPSTMCAQSRRESPPASGVAWASPTTSSWSRASSTSWRRLPARTRWPIAAHCWQGKPRALAVLERAAAEAGWGTPLGPRKGRGIAVLPSSAATSPRLRRWRSPETGEVRVERVICAFDCGVVVNPDTVTAQMQSGIIFGVTAALYGEITLKNGRVEQSNFDNYQMLRIDEAPVIEIDIVPSGEAPGRDRRARHLRRSPGRRQRGACRHRHAVAQAADRSRKS